MIIYEIKNASCAITVQEAGKYSRFHSYLSLDMKLLAPGRTFAALPCPGFQPMAPALCRVAFRYSFRS